MKTEPKPLRAAENTLWPLRINRCEKSAKVKVKVPHGSGGESWELSIHCPSGGARRLVHLIETIGRFSSSTSLQQEPPSDEHPNAADGAIAPLSTQTDSAEDDDPVWSIRVTAADRFDDRVDALGWPPPAALLERWESQLQEINNQLTARGWPLDSLGGNDLWIDVHGALALPVLAARIAQSMWSRQQTVHRQLLEGWQPVLSRESQRAIADLIGGLRQVRQQIATNVPATAARIDSALDPPLGPLPAERAPEDPAPEVPAPEVPAPEVPAPEVPALEVPAHLVPAGARTRFGRTRRRPSAVRRRGLFVLAAAAAALLLAQSGWWLGGSPVTGGRADGEQPWIANSPPSPSDGPAATAAPRRAASGAPRNAVASRGETLDAAGPPLEGEPLETLPRETPLADVPPVELLVEMPIPTLDPLGSGEGSLDLHREGFEPFEPFEPQAAAAAVDGEDGEVPGQVRGEQGALEEPQPAAIDTPQQIEPIQLRLVDEQFSQSWPIPPGADLRRAIATLETLETLDQPLADFSVAWLAPIRAARGRNHRGILELARGDEADVRIRLRCDLRLGREAELAVVAAATLDRGFSWHRVHAAAIPAMIDSWTATRGALASQRRAVENTLDQLPQSPLRTALRGKEKSLGELDRQATAILERIGQLQQLLAEIETRLLLRLTILRSSDPNDPPLLNTLDAPLPHSQPVAGDEETKERPMPSERRGS